MVWDKRRVKVVYEKVIDDDVFYIVGYFGYGMLV